MNDDFKELWERAVDSPYLREALMKSSGGYSIPTGNITEEVFDPDYFTNFPREEDRQTIAQIIKNAMGLKVSELSDMLTELRSALISKEVKGETLNPMEKTLRDLDANKLAFFILILHQKYLYIPAQKKGE